jgi:hypothetical protein
LFQSLLQIKKSDLKCELAVAKNCLENKKKDYEALTQGEILHSVVKYDIYPNIYKLLHVALSIPIGSASCGRSFCSMRRINTYLRSNMAQNRFTNLSILNIERVLSNTIKNAVIIIIILIKKYYFIINVFCY